MKSMKALVALLIVLFGSSVFAGQIGVNINLQDLQMSAGSSEGQKDGKAWSQIYGNLQLTFGTIESSWVSYSPDYVYDSVKEAYVPSPNKGWVNISFSGPETAPSSVQDWISQTLDFSYRGISLTESVSSYAYANTIGDKGNETIVGPIWSCSSGSFYGNFHITGAGQSSFHDYDMDGDNGTSMWFSGNISAPIEWDVPVGVSVPPMSLTRVPEPGTIAMITTIGITAAFGIWRKKR